MTAVLALIVFLITRTVITRPIETLTKGADRIGHGAFDTRFTVRLKAPMVETSGV